MNCKSFKLSWCNAIMFWQDYCQFNIILIPAAMTRSSTWNLNPDHLKSSPLLLKMLETFQCSRQCWKLGSIQLAWNIYRSICFPMEIMNNNRTWYPNEKFLFDFKYPLSKKIGLLLLFLFQCFPQSLLCWGRQTDI